VKDSFSEPKMSVKLSLLRDEAMQDFPGERRGLLAACRVLTGRALFALMWVDGQARVSVELYLSSAEFLWSPGLTRSSLQQTKGIANQSRFKCNTALRSRLMTSIIGVSP
jgi:hypothetical protein